MKFTQTLETMKTGFPFCAVGIFASLIFLCSCATEQSIHRSLPADVPVNQDAHRSLPPDMPISPDAGRGGYLIVTVQLENGQELPMILDTGGGCHCS